MKLREPIKWFEKKDWGLVVFLTILVTYGLYRLGWHRGIAGFLLNIIVNMFGISSGNMIAGLFILPTIQMISFGTLIGIPLYIALKMVSIRK